MSGEKLYQIRARAALPLLIRQAEAGVPIYYSDLAEELGMPNPRNLDYVLGSVGHTMEALSKRWKRKIPPIQCLVINRNTGIPGEGIGWFLIKKEEFRKLPIRRRREIVKAELQKIFAFQDWQEVLKALEIEPAAEDFSGAVTAAVNLTFGGGEGPEHLALKAYVAGRPELFGLRPSCPVSIEERLPSGDCLDVSFLSDKHWVSAEVKSAISGEADLARGLFQCVKYLAVQEAVIRTQRKVRSVRAILVLEGTLPRNLVALRNVLGVDVIESVREIE